MSAPDTEHRDARVKPLPWLSLLTPPNPYSKTGGRTIVIATRPYRSKWTTLICLCKRARKDGTCKTLDQLVPLLRDPDRVRFEHDSKRHRRAPVSSGGSTETEET